MALTVQTFDKLDTALDVDLVVSTLPAGAADSYAEALTTVPAVFDVVYAPWPTPLARAVRAAGGTVVGGFAMLLHQAVRQVELYTGRGEARWRSCERPARPRSSDERLERIDHPHPGARDVLHVAGHQGPSPYERGGRQETVDRGKG